MVYREATPASLEEKKTIAYSRPEAQFIGSFFAMDQLPKDRLPQVAVAGRSNVGKSSLLNQMVGRRKLAKVSSTPGRTRSLNFFKIDNRFYLVDLPGYGYAKVNRSLREQWGRLLEQYLTEGEALIGLVLLLDCRREPTNEDWELIRWLADRELPVMVATTKADKLNRDRLNRRVEQIEQDLGVAVVPTSTVTGIGRKALWASIQELVREHYESIK
jgi:GTP-binding protein